jgi:glycosyltransferase involved in cell wall biosynthesis
MRFSVLICTRNRCQVLSQTLETIRRLQVGPGQTWEVVVVDNASTDATRSVVETFGAKCPVPLRYVLEPREGHSLALNTGVRACGGDIIAFTDDDAYPNTDWLARIDAALETYKADWVFGPVFPRWEAPPPAWHDARTNPLFALLNYGPEPFVVTDPDRPFYGVNHACRREAIDCLGGYREDRGLLAGGGGAVGNDIDLFERALAADLRVVYDPGVAVQHLVPPRRCRKNFHRYRNWASSKDFYQFLRSTRTTVPWLLGLPRYIYRIAACDLGRYWKSLLRGDRPGSFYHELRLIRFAGLFVQAFRFRAMGGLKRQCRREQPLLRSQQSG